ncbi:unnamed protein product [Vicia faba]|uniref:HMA domain-containing protein n=1 Tax=Vicia faba TaxID=3906 RepID=A0AAV0Z010_VICFA|nr:unnamed protein product [Vicia faba]
MDAKPKPSVEPLKYQTWFLKVSIHCEGCRKKVKKVLKRIDGVFTATIDSQQHKVTVTGNVNVEILLKKLVRAGKPAEIWPESDDGKGKNSGKEKKKKNENENEPKETQSLQNKGTESGNKCENETKNKNKYSKTSAGELPVKSPVNSNVTPVGGGEGSDNKKKKKKDGNGNGNGNNGLSSVAKNGPSHTGFQFQNLDQGMAHQVNLSPTRQQSFFYPSETCYPPMAYVSSAYNRLYPMGRVCDPSYHVPSLPYTCPYSLVNQYGTYQLQSAPSVSFEFFSDENANGCSIM